jgi:hypothetical protein
VVAAVLRWDDWNDDRPRDQSHGPQGESHRPRTVVRGLRKGDPVPPAYRALLLALWEARRLGARALTLSTDNADVVTQLLGTVPPPPEAVGAYLQVRALRNAFRSVAVEWRTPVHGGDAALAAAAAGARACPAQPVCTDLPLWAAAV